VARGDENRHAVVVPFAKHSGSALDGDDGVGLNGGAEGDGGGGDTGGGDGVGGGGVGGGGVGGGDMGGDMGGGNVGGGDVRGDSGGDDGGELGYSPDPDEYSASPSTSSPGSNCCAN